MSIFRKIWAVYSYFHIAWVVILTSIIIFFTSLIFGKKALKFNCFICLNISSPLILILSGIWVKVKGKENLNPNQGYVIVGNHLSYLDIFAHPTSVPYNCLFTYLAKMELAKTPFFGIIARNLAVLVDRKSIESRKKSYIYMQRVLETGISIFLYPEGTRNKTEEPLLNFHDGAFKLAIDMNVPIVVITLVGMRQINDIRKPLNIAPGIIRSYIEPPIMVEGKTKDELKEEVKKLMLTRLQS